MKNPVVSSFIILFISFFTVAQYAMAQQKCPPSENKKAQKWFKEAQDAKKDRKQFSEINEDCRKALAEDSAFGDVYHFLGDVAFMSHNDKVMAEAYAKLIELCPDVSTDAYYRLGNYQYQQKDFVNAIKNLQSFLDFGKVKEENARDAGQKITRAQLMMHPVPFNPVPLKNVSSGDPEYLAVISPDQDFCFFTRRFDEQKRGTLYPQSVEKFMVSKKINGEFDAGTPMPFPFNKSSSNNEGGASISIDNRHLFFTINKNGNFDIYTSDETKGVWSDPHSIGDKVNDPKQWDSQPCVAPDGKTLYFASFRDSVIQTSDLYVTKKDSAGNWGKPKPLGPPVNTPGNEKTPFLHPDSKTLYFSSDYLPGMGGYDIFMSKMKPDGTWSTPVNLGYPINTEADEVGFFVSTDGKKGYYASNALKGVGGYDIYEFDLPEKVKPEKVLFIKGELKGADNKSPGDAKLELKNAVTHEAVEVNYDSLSGKYASVVSFNEDYILTVKKQGFAYNSAYFSAADSTNTEPKKVDLLMQKTEVGQPYQLNNILFPVNSSTLTVQDKNIIIDFAEYLKANSSIRIAIQGHTDNQGNAADNLKLSDDRAREVFNFLVKCGVPPARVTFKGYGQTKPVASNDSEEGRAQNRRTEFLITAK